MLYLGLDNWRQVLGTLNTEAEHKARAERGGTIAHSGVHLKFQNLVFIQELHIQGSFNVLGDAICGINCD